MAEEAMAPEVRPERIQPTTSAEVLRAEAHLQGAVPVRRLSMGWAVAPLFVLDAAAVVVSMVAAYHLRFRALPYLDEYSAAFYGRLIVFSVPLWWAVFALYQLYHADRLFGGLHEYAGIFNACGSTLLCLVLLNFLDRRSSQEISRGWLAIVWVFSALTVSATRFGYRRLIYRLRHSGHFVRRVLIVGSNAESQAVLTQLRASRSAGTDVIGVVGAKGHIPDLRGPATLGDLGSLPQLVRSLAIDELIVVPTALEREELLGLYRDWGIDSRVRLSLSSGLYELFTTGVQVRETAAVPLVELNRTRITGMDAAIKAVLDYAVALALAAGLLIALPVIALAIRLDSRGPVIYRRRVVGLHGREFDAYKLRTMVYDADRYLDAHPALKREWDQTGKIQDDPRITRLGRLLRRFSLDELPQVFNVLKGQMSLVGPRMITPAEQAHFGQWRHNLLTVKPGMTGLWQISGRAELQYAERVQLDMRYIREYTIWLDLQILLNTLVAVLRGRGAY